MAKRIKKIDTSGTPATPQVKQDDPVEAKPVAPAAPVHPVKPQERPVAPEVPPVVAPAKTDMQTTATPPKPAVQPKKRIRVRKKATKHLSVAVLCANPVIGRFS